MNRQYPNSNKNLSGIVWTLLQDSDQIYPGFFLVELFEPSGLLSGVKLIMKLKSIIVFTTCFLFSAFFLMTACSGTSNSPAEAVEDYLTALSEGDQNGMINNACSTWESQAILEYDSFAAVDTVLEEFSCQVSQENDGSAVVDCTGRLVASYGEEDLIIELNERSYLVENEAGQWRLCGYQ